MTSAIFRQLQPRPRTPDEQAARLVDTLAEAIFENKNPDGSTGMPYREWRGFAQQEISTVIREVEMRAIARESFSARNMARNLTRATLLVLAVAFSFISFWGGVVYVGQTYGMAWGIGCALSAAALAAAFGIAALLE